MDWFPSDPKYGPIHYTTRAHAFAGGGYFGRLTPRGEKGRQWDLEVVFVWNQQQQETIYRGRIDGKSVAEAKAKAEKKIDAVVAEDRGVQHDPVRARALATEHIAKILPTCGRWDADPCPLNKDIADYLAQRWGMDSDEAKELADRMHPHRRFWNPRKLSMFRRPKGHKYRVKDIRPGARPPDAWDDIPKGNENFGYLRAAKRMVKQGWSRPRIIEKLRTRWGLSLRDAEKTADRAFTAKITYKAAERSVQETYVADSVQDAKDHARRQMLTGPYTWANHAEVRIP